MSDTNDTTSRSFERCPDGYILDSGSSPPKTLSFRSNYSNYSNQRRKTDQRTKLDLVKNINWLDSRFRKINRCGCLFYTFGTDQPDSLKLCFGVDARTGELTDFSGGRKLHETILDCAVREANEESRYAFGLLESQDIQNHYCLWNETMIMILVPVRGENDDIVAVSIDNFNRSTATMTDQQGQLLPCYAETCQLLWVDYRDMRIHTARLYDKVRNFLRNSDIWNENLGLLLSQ